MAGVFGISRHRICVDGKGITTLVVVHGCPLDCKYCLNPQCHEESGKIKSRSAGQLYDVVKKDSLYFLATGGGVTFGGGEPLLHHDFIKSFKALCNDEWCINLETSLYAPTNIVLELAPIIDHWIIDIKDTNNEVYKAYTGKDNLLVKSNLMELIKLGANITVRVPHIPNFNTPEDVARSISELKEMGVTDIDEFTYTIRQR